jgi:hypothetical protein
MSLDLSLVDEFNPAREAALFEAETAFLALYGARGRRLGFVAAHHTTEPQSATFRSIDAAFDTVDPAVVLLEGAPSQDGYNPRQILSGLVHPSRTALNSWDRGEGAYAAAQALARGALILGGEPTDAILFERLSALGFRDDDIFFSALLGPLQQDRDAAVFASAHSKAFSSAFNCWSDQLCRRRSRDLAYQQGAFENWCRNRMGQDVFDDPNWLRRGNPGCDGIAAAVNRAANRIRDYHLMDLATRLLKRRQRVVIVFGASHLSSLWRGLAMVFGPPVIITQ